MPNASHWGLLFQGEGANYGGRKNKFLIHIHLLDTGIIIDPAIEDWEGACEA